MGSETTNYGSGKWSADSSGGVVFFLITPLLFVLTHADSDSLFGSWPSSASWFCPYHPRCRQGK